MSIININDFKLQKNSPCIDSGAYLGEKLNFDFNGNIRNDKPDIGTLEYK